MKANVKQYARSLFELLEGKNESEAKGLIANFVAFLYRRQDLDKAKAIINELESLYDGADGLTRAELWSSRPLDGQVKSKISAYIKSKSGKSDVELSENIDKDLIGGFVLRYKGLV
ncbi:hypothetical protein EOM82_08720, partial [bacterium]|nr:hypothetical protein [bacterium]